MRDDNVKERHGCEARKGEVRLFQVERGVQVSADYGSVLSPSQARYIARKLYHLARKAERLYAQAIEARRAETLGSVHESAVTEGDAP